MVCCLCRVHTKLFLSVTGSPSNSSACHHAYEWFGVDESLMSKCVSFHRLRKKNVEIPYVVHVSLLDGHVSPSEGQSSELAAVTTERWYMAPGVRRIEIRQNKVVGTLFLPPGEHMI